MTMKGFYQTYLDIIDTIDEAIEKRRMVPALILVYSAIDSFSKIANRSNEKGRKVFIDWVDRWMTGNLPTGKEIYSARCGLVHEAGSESDLTRCGNVRQVIYYWGDTNQETIESDIHRFPSPKKIVAVKIEDLVTSFRNGMANCLETVEADQEWYAVFQQKAQAYFINVSSHSG